MAGECIPTRTEKGIRLLDDRFCFANLRTGGRLQFFFHCGQSELPVRDVLRRNKTEPHIERNAENYLNPCHQSTNIVPLLRSSDKYLFLFTTCRCSALGAYYGKRFVVGYIQKERAIPREGGRFFAVQGKTKLVAFHDALPLANLISNPMKIRLREVDESEASRILGHLKKAENILPECLAELKRLKALTKW